MRPPLRFEICLILFFCEQLYVVVSAVWSRPKVDCDILPIDRIQSAAWLSFVHVAHASSLSVGDYIQQLLKYQPIQSLT